MDSRVRGSNIELFPVALFHHPEILRSLRFLPALRGKQNDILYKAPTGGEEKRKRLDFRWSLR
jgi:hypothetical protein